MKKKRNVNKDMMVVHGVLFGIWFGISFMVFFVIVGSLLEPSPDDVNRGAIAIWIGSTITSRIMYEKTRRDYEL